MSRGTTRPGRLRLLDQALLSWLDEVPSPAVELGVGARPDAKRPVPIPLNRGGKWT